VYFILILFAFLSTFLAVFLVRYLPKYLDMQHKLTYKPLHSPYKLKPYFHKNIFILFYVVTLLIFFFISHFFHANLHSYLLMFFCWVVLVLVMIDFITLYLPDSITLTMIWLGLLKEYFGPTQLIGMKEAVMGAALSYIFLRLLSEIFFFVRNKEPLGRGDMKFFAMIGAWCGFEATLFTIILSSFGVCIWYASKLFIFKPKKNKMNQYFPYGPWIGLGIFTYIILSH
jgi:leader peptidase (prepilin peptidase)/N-methyltransferase